MKNLALVLCAAASLAQDQKPDAVYSTDVKVVNVYATVHDKTGKIIQNLSKDDFALTDDDRPQTIKYFARQTDLPLTLGLLVDTSLSMSGVLEEERRASYKFFEKVMREDKDQAFVIHFDHEVELLRDLTSSRKDLERSLRELQTPELRRRQPDEEGQRRPRNNAGTQLYDSILLGSDELMKKQTGRKAMILLSDGDDFGSRVSLASAIESAQRADTLVYAIRMVDDKFAGGRQGGRPGGGIGFPGGGRGRGGMGGGRGGGKRIPGENRPDGKKVMERIARETGGAFFDVTKKDNLDKIFARIEEELRNQYSLGFTPDKSPDGEYHKLALTLPKQKALVVQTRDGYYASVKK